MDTANILNKALEKGEELMKDKLRLFSQEDAYLVVDDAGYVNVLPSASIVDATLRHRAKYWGTRYAAFRYYRQGVFFSELYFNVYDDEYEFYLTPLLD